MKKITLMIMVLAIVVGALYGLGRLYYVLTDGFTIANMSADFAYHPEWDITPLLPDEKRVLDNALSQPYTYLAKGCQAYVFQSQDGQYVIKFFKYQRFRLKPWEEVLPSWPFIESYRQEKRLHKQQKLERFLLSWVVAFNELKRETGLIYVHLNKSTDVKKKLSIIDKIGISHLIDLDEVQFCVQRKAEMLSDVLQRLKGEGRQAEADRLLSRVMGLLISGYARGYTDNDPALMQNTGVVDGRPIYVDIGQLVHDEEVKDPDVALPLFMIKTREVMSNE